jgi:hypothetical protein
MCIEKGAGLMKTGPSEADFSDLDVYRFCELVV